MTVKELAAALAKLPAEDQKKQAVYVSAGSTYLIEELLPDRNRDVGGLAGAHDVIELA